MSFNSIRENKILAKISEFTVTETCKKKPSFVCETKNDSNQATETSKNHVSLEV